MLDIICASPATIPIFSAAPEFAHQNLKISSVAKASRQEFSAQLLGRNLVHAQEELQTQEWREQVAKSTTSHYERKDCILTLYLDNCISIHSITYEVSFDDAAARRKPTSSPTMVHISGGRASPRSEGVPFLTLLGGILVLGFVWKVVALQESEVVWNLGRRVKARRGRRALNRKWLR